MKTNCAIVSDLLPLYQEGLLEDETKEWVEHHLNNCEQCSHMHDLADQPLDQEEITSPVDHEKMMSKITFKLSLYQMILLGISFFLAIRTVILEESFEFILYYTILGLVTYLFYKNLKFVVIIAFLPVFIWHFGMMLPDFKAHAERLSTTPVNMIFDLSMASFLMGVMHLLFAVVGAVIGWCILKLTESEDSS